MDIFPTTAVADVTTGFLAVVTANMAVVLGLLAFFVGITWITARLNRAKKGKI